MWADLPIQFSLDRTDRTIDIGIHTVPGIITNINKKSIFARIRNREVRYAHA
jgi:hypothetical protein